MAEDPKEKYISEKISQTKNSLAYSGISCVIFLALGGLITGITYSMADPGGSYTVTTGLFLVGALSGVVAIWRLIQLCFYVAKRGSRQQEQVLLRRMHETGNKRSWKDLE